MRKSRIPCLSRSKLTDPVTKRRELSQNQLTASVISHLKCTVSLLHRFSGLLNRSVTIAHAITEVTCDFHVLTAPSC